VCRLSLENVGYFKLTLELMSVTQKDVPSSVNSSILSFSAIILFLKPQHFHAAVNKKCVGISKKDSLIGFYYGVANAF
jgi:hypothetical protein